MNRVMMRGKQIFVGEAKYRRKILRHNMRGKEAEVIDKQHAGRKNSQIRTERVAEVKVGRQPSDAPGKDPNTKGLTKKIEVQIASENVVWLQRSIVGGTKLAIDFNTLQQKVHRDWPHVIQIRELGAYKAMLRFDTVLSAEEAYTFKMNDLLKLFHMEWRWDETEKSESRRVWLDCYGVPLHAWSRDTFHRIGEQWGEVVTCDKLIESYNSFSVGRVLIYTCAFDMINESIHITIGTSVFDVLVREVGGEVYREECFQKCQNKTEGRDMLNGKEIRDSRMGSLLNYSDEWKVREDFQGTFDININKDIDSEDTVSNNYEDYFGNQTYENTRKTNGLAANRPNKLALGNETGLNERARWAGDAAGPSNRVRPDPVPNLTQQETHASLQAATRMARSSRVSTEAGRTARADGRGRPASEAEASEPGALLTRRGTQSLMVQLTPTEPGFGSRGLQHDRDDGRGQQCHMEEAIEK
ncbi:hypothetical protein AHAS_Ahas04G0175600 [Arachis hypogaea]